MITIPTILRERYKLTAVVGTGGMGSVYRAEDTRLPGRLCAIKEVQADPNLSPEMQAQAASQFLQEASVLARLDHPTLPKVSDFFSGHGSDFLVMDYVPGDDLQRRIDQAPAGIEEPIVRLWAEQITDALAYLHKQQPPVLHRDIKPANIKITPDGRIKLVDFGLVKLMAQDGARTITVVQGRGTAMYTPLEQYGNDSGHTDVRTDIYALGATLYHLLCDSPPPDAKTRFLNPHAMKSPHEVNKNISQTMSNAIMWAMEMHPNQRPSSIQQFCEVMRGNATRNSYGEQPDPTMIDALRANLPLVLMVFLLFLAAVLLTIL
jgi:serine/threonine-protein kinase